LAQNIIMSLTKQDLIEICYVVMGGIFGTIETILIQFMVIGKPIPLIFSSLAFMGVLFCLYKILIKLSKGVLIVKILKITRKFYGLDDFK